MASIKQAIEKNQQRIAAGGDTKTGLGPQPPESPIVAAPSPQLDLPLGGGLPQRGTFPAELVLGGDINDSNRMYRGAGMRSAAFPSPATSSVTKSTTVVEAASVSPSTSTTVLLQTNGINNPNQKILNLVAGSGIAISADPTGTDTISATGGSGGDGLIHGDAIWDVDDAVVWQRDDFSFAGGLAGGVGYGELGWYASGATSGTGLYISNAPPALGGLQWTNNGTPNGTLSFFPGPSQQANYSISMWPLLENPGWKLVWNWTFTRSQETGFSTSLTPVFSMAQTSFYIGLQTTLGLPMSQGRPNIFIGLRYDTDTTSPSIGDTTMKFEVVVNPLTGSRNNVQGSVFDTGLAPIEGQNYRLEIECVATGVVTISINGSTPQSFTVPTITVSSATVNASVGANGLGYVGYSTATNGLSPFTQGSTVSVTAGSLSGTYQAFQGDNGGSAVILGPGVATIAETFQANTITGYPAFYPAMTFGNDSSLSPAAGTKSANLDFFAFVWNPGVGGGTGTPNPLLPRYWA